ncbi:MAG: tRNA (adenosine(37)-N6)-dimethylallyltransferase MiaA [Bacteroides sp.]|nr:tRNA (adenosine(37)-N6)-dimethylallyltransferase MiaA [Bacteroides sp.]MDD2645018.1 tRNA (adenosine(37)-N6)-dimethylallyltransferase MiaA [Bacteroides sp.]MDD4054775.1 tRNA (adenosine(37)-N6)-dimethylallyltransferase MiaA [Bacteroides sp.]MDD4719311.1 tRNA (adenosine(37)-N6)-dimethylallyltransferase MiaA [Bacteroides sp.]NLI63365.1 tRNA (adenosine(37)-N6)-dimethylallyltransferase MiaA [Bacteroidales bacterium]
MKQNTLIVLVGPTGVGKTELSLRIAEHLNTCIISADSRQLYKGIEIGTAAPTSEQLERVKHFFVGILNLSEYYSAAQYEVEVLKKLDSLFPSYPNILLTGGSMLYVDAVCKGIDDMPTVDRDTRNFMQEKYKKEGLDGLTRELKLLDPDYYYKVDLKNHKRIIHALEVCYMTGKPYSSFRTKEDKKRPFNILKIGLQRDRDELYNRINKRVEEMVEQGVIEEAKRVFHQRKLNSLNTVGYKELFKYIEGEWDLSFAIQKIQRNTRVYSKKQMTWFKRDTDIHWFHPSEENNILSFIDEKLSI